MKAKANQQFHPLVRARKIGANRVPPTRKAKSTCHECGQRGHWAVIVDVLERETRTTRLGQTNTCCRIVRISARTRLLSRICNNALSMRTHPLWQQILSITYLSSLALFLLRSQQTREIGRSVMESTVCGEFKSDLGMGIIDTACLFCVVRKT